MTFVINVIYDINVSVTKTELIVSARLYIFSTLRGRVKRVTEESQRFTSVDSLLNQNIVQSSGNISLP